MNQYHPLEEVILAIRTPADVDKEYDRLLCSIPAARAAWNAAEFNQFSMEHKMKLIAVTLGAALHNTQIVLLEKVENCTCPIRRP